MKIPENLKISGEINSYSGDIKIGSIDFTGAIKTYCGDISFEKLKTKNLKLNSYNGDVSIEKLTGAIYITLYSGDVSIKESFIHKLNINSYSGDIKMQNVQLDLHAKSAITAKSGDVDLEIKKYAGTRELHLKTLIIWRETKQNALRNPNL